MKNEAFLIVADVSSGDSRSPRVSKIAFAIVVKKGIFVKIVRRKKPRSIVAGRNILVRGFLLKKRRVLGRKKRTIPIRRTKTGPSIRTARRRRQEKKTRKKRLAFGVSRKRTKRKSVIQRLASMTFSVREKRENHHIGKEKRKSDPKI